MRDWLLYVVIAVLLVAAIVAYASYQATRGGSPDLPLKWPGFVGMTAVVFGYAIRSCRRYWRNGRFWLLVIMFFTVHSGIGVFALTRVAVVPLLLYAMLTGPEYIVLAVYLGYFLDSK